MDDKCAVSSERPAKAPVAEAAPDVAEPDDPILIPVEVACMLMDYLVSKANQ